MIALILAATQTFSLSGSAAHAIAVWVGGPAAAPTAGTFEMHNVNRTFTPSSIVVPVGSQVRFPNDDPFEHSIYSTDKLNGFDIGFYGHGPGKYVTFNHVGVVQVRCHIHAYMHGTIVVAGGPYAQVIGGVYQIGNLPAGAYVVHEITDDGADHTTRVTLDADKTLNF
jgi:plastocyanin